MVHCVSRSVRDSAALLDATRGPTIGERWLAAPPTRPYLDEVGASPGKLRVAFCITDFSGNKVDPDCVAAVQSTAKLCEELGHTVEQTTPKFDGQGFSDAFLVLWAAVAGRVVKGVKKMLGSKLREDAFEPWTWRLAELDAKHTPADVSLAWMGPLQTVNNEMIRFLATYDVLLTPVLARPPVKTGELDQSWDTDKIIGWLQGYCPFTPLANATGQPAMSVPLYWNSAGLPIGSHFIGRHGDEATLLRLAAQLEQARPWAKRWPVMAGAERGESCVVSGCPRGAVYGALWAPLKSARKRRRSRAPLGPKNPITLALVVFQLLRLRHARKIGLDGVRCPPRVSAFGAPTTELSGPPRTLSRPPGTLAAPSTDLPLQPQSADFAVLVFCPPQPHSPLALPDVAAAAAASRPARSRSTRRRSSSRRSATACRRPAIDAV